MNRFAELLDRLAYEPGRKNKLRLITAYFREVADPDRGYALAALTGALSFKHAKPGLIRDLIADRTDPVLFALSYDYVGDLSETVALMWPKRAAAREESLLGHPSPQPSPARGEGAERGLGRSAETTTTVAPITLSVPSSAASSSPLLPRSGGEGSGAYALG
jgi:DNA ligase-1